jgi:signal transduction histidine kinase
MTKISKYTIELPPGLPGGQFLIVNDLASDPRFPDVSSPFKFYAGTPITTSSGINIGSICVLDEEARNGLTEEEKSLLGSMAGVCMDYLELIRHTSEGRKTMRMASGIYSFVERKITTLTTDELRPSDVTSTGSTERLSTFQESASPESLPSLDHHLPPGLDRYPSTTSAPLRAGSIPHEISNEEKDKLQLLVAGAAPHVQERLKEIAESDAMEREWTYVRSANLLRECLNLDTDGGVAIYDTSHLSIKSTETHSLDQYIASEIPKMSETPGGPWDTSLGEDEFMFTSSIKPTFRTQADAEILATSSSSEPIGFGSIMDSGDPSFKPISAVILSELLKRYPRGKSWQMNSNFYPPLDSEEEDIIRWTANERQILQELFPKAQHLMFIPIWDAGLSQWPSVIFASSSLEFRWFSIENELSLAMAFGKTILAEIKRIETLRADRLKGDFIGSISHELRSPLHGILASLDLLLETDFDSLQESLLLTIDSCGRTLLDTINHILEFSHMNTLERDWKRKRRKSSVTKEHPSRLSDPNSPSEMESLSETHLSTNIASVLEEVVEGLIAEKSSQSFNSQDSLGGEMVHSAARRKEARDSTPVTAQSNLNLPQDVEIVFNINKEDWLFEIQPGALRRCFMNVLGNAIKYTDKGQILVQLSSEQLPGSQTGPDRLITFRVTDSGRGMSAAFLKSKIFTPFAQEDHLAPGVGLGLSIVRSITMILGGTIDIQSQQSQGTSVTLKIPLFRPSGFADPSMIPPLVYQDPGKDLIECLRQRVGSRSVVICGYDPGNTDLPPMSPIRYLVAYLRDWCGLNLVAWGPSAQEADFVIARKEHLSTLETMLKGLHDKRRGLILLSRMLEGFELNSPTISEMRLVIQIFTEPYGPYKLAKVFLQCLARLERCSSPILESANVEAGYAQSLPYHQRDDQSSTNTTSGTPQGEAPKDEGATASTFPIVVEAHADPIAHLEANQWPAAVEVNDDGIPQTDDKQDEKLNVENISDASDYASGRKVRILIVEDNMINQKLLKMFLKKRNYQAVDCAENGRLAFQAVESAVTPYDIIFMGTYSLSIVVLLIFSIIYLPYNVIRY